jgi:hypothetical protein
VIICRTCGIANDESAAVCRVCGRPPTAPPLAEIPPEVRKPVAPVLTSPGSEKVRVQGPPQMPAAVVSAICGIVGAVVLVIVLISSFAVSAVVALFTALPLILAFGAIISGHLAQRFIADSEEPVRGAGLATTGLILGYSQLALAGLALLGGCVFASVSILLDGFGP